MYAGSNHSILMMDKMKRIKIKNIGITDIEADAIVNAANSGLLAGGGVCGAIFCAAGYNELQDACDKIGHCYECSAVITDGFKLKAKYIIHAVGPRWIDGNHNEPQHLYGAYRRALELAVEYGCKTMLSHLFQQVFLDIHLKARGERLYNHALISLTKMFVILKLYSRFLMIEL